MFQFIALVASAQIERTESLMRATIGLLGDLASAFPNGELKGLLSASWVAEFIKAGRGRGNGVETRKTASWAREVRCMFSLATCLDLGYGFADSDFLLFADGQEGLGVNNEVDDTTLE